MLNDFMLIAIKLKIGKCLISDSEFKLDVKLAFQHIRKLQMCDISDDGQAFDFVVRNSFSR